MKIANKSFLLHKKTIKQEVARYLFMILGCLSYALSLEAFLIPNNIVGGGVSGAASLIHILTKSNYILTFINKFITN